MFRPLSLYIGLRYTRAKRRNHFISFISFASVAGIALGVAVLITVLSVMNGFDYEIHNRVFSMARQVTVSGFSGSIDNWKEISEAVAKNKNVIASAPFVSGQGMLSSDGQVRGVMVEGVLPEREIKISDIQKTFVAGSFSQLKEGEFGVVLGQEIASYLNAKVGDKVILITPAAVMTPIGMEPRFKKFTVVGIFHVGEGFGYDSTTAFVNIYDAQKLFGFGNKITGINIKISDLYKAPTISEELSTALHGQYFVSDWTSQYGTYFKAVRMEKTMMFVVLMFIVAVAAFNLVSSLVMTVTDKQSDIAILRTLGASPQTVMNIFIVQGGIIGVFGTLLGVLGGILLALNAPMLVSTLEHLLHTHFISAGVYFIDYLPSRLELSDVWHIGLMAFVMSLLATIYPAWRAAKTEPAEALRYE